MDHDEARVEGAAAPQGPEDQTLSGLAATLINLSTEEKQNLQGYDADTCDTLLRELVEFVNNPAGKTARTKGDVLGQMFLLYERKTQLERDQLLLERDQLLLENRRLQERDRRTQIDMSRMREKMDALHIQVQSIKAESDDAHSTDQTVTASAVTGTVNQGQAAPNRGQSSPTGMDEGTRLLTELQAIQSMKRRLQQRIRDHQASTENTPVAGDSCRPPPAVCSWEQSTPVVLDSYHGSPSASLWEQDTPVAAGTHRVPLVTRSQDAGATPSFLSRPPMRPDHRGRDSMHTLVSGPYATQSQHPHVHWTPSQPYQRRNPPHQDDLGNYGTPGTQTALPTGRITDPGGWRPD